MTLWLAEDRAAEELNGPSAEAMIVVRFELWARNKHIGANKIPEENVWNDVLACLGRREVLIH